jgi:tetratricopeptide (TPR) repeat protein
VLTAAPRDATALLDRGAAYFELKKYGLAISDYKAALRFTPRDPRLWDNLGSAYGAAGQLDEAIATYNQALRVRPDYREALRDRAGAINAKATGQKVFVTAAP